MLFCGQEFNDGFKLTAIELAGDPRFDVVCCRREDVDAHIAGAHIAVRGRLACCVAGRPERACLRGARHDGSRAANA